MKRIFSHISIFILAICCLPILDADSVRGASQTPGALTNSTQITTGLHPRRLPIKPRSTSIGATGYNGHVVVKLREGLTVTQAAGRLLEKNRGDLQGVNTVLARPSVTDLRRVFSRPLADLRAERLAAEAKSGRQLADLSLYYRVEVSSAAAAKSIIDELNAEADVEIAYYQPAPEPAEGPAEPAVTPNFQVDQDYLEPAPGGVDAYYSWGQPGGRGQGVQIIDIEGAWRDTHEDLTSSLGGELSGSQMTALDWRNHGTAVLGEMIADSNGFGVTGIAYGAEIGMVSISSLSTAEALSLATESLEPGDAILIELHAPGPRYNFESRDDQLGYIAMEYWQANFDAIQIATAKGILVCEAAGNGAENFDDAIYESVFDTTYRNSHAIVCGAGAPPSGAYGADRSRLGFSNYGERVNLQGYGRGVVTTGYGGLYSTGGEDYYYTSTFSGTSSASPIVTGAVACLSGHYQATYGVSATVDYVRELLVATGSPQYPNEAQKIGPRPDLEAAYAAMSAPPEISVSPVYIDTGITEGDLKSFTITITNDQTSPDWDFEAVALDTMLYRAPAADWLTVSPASGTVLAGGGTFDLTVTVDASLINAVDGLAKGTIQLQTQGGVPAYTLLVPVFITLLCADDETYLVSDSDQPQGPDYAWVDAVSLGSLIPQGTFYNTTNPGAALDDGTAGPLAIGFDFDFYGTLYSELYVGINGAISFTETEINSNGYFAGTSIPGAFIDNAVFAFWNDLVVDPSFGHGDLFTYQSAANDTFVVEWYQIGNFNDDADTLTTFEIIMTTDGSIAIQFADIGTTGLEQTATVGLQATGCAFEPYVDGSDPVENEPHADLIVTFDLPGAGCDCTGFGNLDGNPGINPVDVVHLVNYVYKSIDPPTVELPDCPGIDGDWNCDGVVNPVDVVMIVNYVYKSILSALCDPCACTSYPDNCP